MPVPMNMVTPAHDSTAICTSGSLVGDGLTRVSTGALGGVTINANGLVSSLPVRIASSLALRRNTAEAASTAGSEIVTLVASGSTGPSDANAPPSSCSSSTAFVTGTSLAMCVTRVSDSPPRSAAGGSPKRTCRIGSPSSPPLPSLTPLPPCTPSRSTLPRPPPSQPPIASMTTSTRTLCARRRRGTMNPTFESMLDHPPHGR